MSAFTEIGAGIHLLRPQDDLKANDSHPDIVIIFGWMGAQLPHLHKYTDVYRKTYPSSTQLLIQCDHSFFWSTIHHQDRALGPAVEVIRAFDSSTSLDSPRILVHTFSNGGSMQMTTFGRLLSRQGTSKRLQNAPNALVLDSCPGSDGLAGSQRAFSAAMPNRLARWAMTIVVTIMHFVSLLLGEQVITVVNAGLNRLPTESSKELCLPPWMTANTPRLYMYSKPDDLVPWKQVEAHANQARALGIAKVAKDVVFEDTPHVAHMRAHPKRYWEAVWDLWGTVEASK